MKTKTHYLYGFIIVSLVLALVITSLSKPTPKRIETTPPVEITTEMVPLPPSDTDDDTDDSTEKIYNDKYYTVATYVFFFCAICCLTILLLVYVYKKKLDLDVFFLVLLNFFLIITYFVIYFISMIRDTLHVNQYIILSLYLPSAVYICFILIKYLHDE